MSDDAIKVTVNGNGEGRNYVLRWTDPISGKKCRESTKTTKLRAAMKKAAEKERELNSGGYCRPSKIYWSDFRDQWMAEKGPEVSPRTVEATVSAMNHVERLLNPDRLAKMTTAAVGRLKSLFREEGMKPTTIAAHLAHLRAALSWAHGRGLLAVMPKVEKPRRAKGQAFMRGRPINAEEFDRMLAVVPKVRPYDAAVWQRYLRGLWLSGLRLEESLALSWSPDAPFAVDLTGHGPVFRIRAEAQKARRDEEIAMAPDFAEMLLETPAAERRGRVFRLDGLTTGRPLTSKRVSKLVSKFGERAGIIVNRTRKKVAEEQPDGTVQRVMRDDVPEFATCHTLRRSFGSRWARQVSTAVLQSLMRHASIETTKRYYVHLDATDLAGELWANWSQSERGGHAIGHTYPERAENENGVPGVAPPETPYDATL